MLSTRLRHGAAKTASMERERHRAVAWSRRVKRAESHLPGAAVASAFVLVIEKLEMLLTPEMRDARALGLERGGRTDAAKSSPMNATSTRSAQLVFFCFICGIFDIVLRRLTLGLTGAALLTPKTQTERDRCVQ